jgi:DNA-binding NarL/FixJ family response regulator
MSPRKKHSVPELQAQRIVDALAARTEAQLQVEQAVFNALNAGGSVREVAALSGLSGTTVQKYGRTRGWPAT